MHCRFTMQVSRPILLLPLSLCFDMGHATDRNNKFEPVRQSRQASKNFAACDAAQSEKTQGISMSASNRNHRHGNRTCHFILLKFFSVNRRNALLIRGEYGEWSARLLQNKRRCMMHRKTRQPEVRDGAGDYLLSVTACLAKCGFERSCVRYTD